MKVAYDIVVLGGGPAGSLSAVLLARAGYRVAIVAQPRRFGAIEGVAPRAVTALEAHACACAVGAIGVQVRRKVSWNGEQSSANTEHVVERAGFDASLLADAEHAGAAVIGARAGRIHAQSNCWKINLLNGDADGVIAAFVVDARGRTAPLLNAQRVAGPPTTALARAWRLPRNTPPHTGLAAFEDGWVWFASDCEGYAVLQVLVSSATGELPGRRALTSHYASLIARLDETKIWLDGATPVGAVSARAASASLVRPLVGVGCLRAGDAAMSIDPLSGHGIFEALAGALAAAPVVNTLLARPEREDVARRYYEDRAEEAFWRHARVGRTFYAQEARWLQRSFWRARSAWPDQLAPHAAPSSAQPFIDTRPVVKDGFIGSEDVIVTPDHPRGVWQVAGVPLVELMGLLRDRQLDAERAAASLRLPSSQVHTAKGWLEHRGLLGPAVDPSGQMGTD